MIFILGAEAIRNQSVASLGGLCATNELLGLGFDHQKIRSAEVEKVQLDDIRRVAQKYFRNGKYVDVVVGPPASKADQTLHDPAKAP